MYRYIFVNIIMRIVAAAHRFFEYIFAFACVLLFVVSSPSQQQQQQQQQKKNTW